MLVTFFRIEITDRESRDNINETKAYILSAVNIELINKSMTNK